MDQVGRSAKLEYRPAASLVIESDRTRGPRSNEPTGEAISLAGKTNIGRMGDRVAGSARATTSTTTRPAEVIALAEKAAAKRKKQQQQEISSGGGGGFGRGGYSGGGGSRSVFEDAAGEGLHYVPRNKDTRVAWEQLLSLTQPLLGDVSHDVLAGAAEEITSILRDKELRETEKRQNVNTLLGTNVSEAGYVRMVNLSRALVDFVDESSSSSSNAAANGAGGGTAEFEEEGVAVVFDEDEDAEEATGEYADVVVDEDDERRRDGPGGDRYNDEEEEEEEMEGGSQEQRRVGGGNSNAAALHMDESNSSAMDEELGGSSSTTGRRRVVGGGKQQQQQLPLTAAEFDAEDTSRGLLPVSSIDAFWLQRQVSAYIEDATAAQKMTADIVSALTESIQSSSSSSSLSSSSSASGTEVGTADYRALENQLVALLEFDKFDLIRTIVANAPRILYVTRYRQAQTDEDKAQIRAEMLLDTLHGGPGLVQRLIASGMGPSSDAWAQTRAASIGEKLRREARELAERAKSRGNGAANVGIGAGGGGGDDQEDESVFVSGTTTSIPSSSSSSSSSSIAASSAAKRNIISAAAIGPSLVGAGAGTSAAAAAAAAIATSEADDDGYPSTRRPQEEVDLESLAFTQGARLMTNKKVALPDKSWRATKKGYEEVHVPAPKPKPLGPNEKEVLITSMPGWSQAAFEGMTKLNRVQSRLYDTALGTSENMLLCAPTGAGKTNVAVLTILQTLDMYRNRSEDGGDDSFDISAFKIIYVAPMKALVQEVVSNLSRRLGEPYGLTVRELSGDQSMTKAEIEATQIIVTTPEKWDVITRKAGERTYTQLVRLIIIDEIHLLHDERGPVLEALVARTLRQVEVSKEQVRIIGLSATLPNFEDVASFLRVRPDKGLFTFDSSYRPAPLQQQYIGVTEKKPLKRLALMNEICYEKVLEQAGKNQVLIFVHSRKETARTARAIKDMFVAGQTSAQLLPETGASKEILLTEADECGNSDLKELMPFGFGVHHAGMTRVDRTRVEELFAAGHMQVLVSTATLAWGVNLPAHTVIIKGTQIYSPEKGKWTELSPLDVMQMLGRAGRPQYDTFGEGIIITAHSELQYYLSLMNQQLPVESQLIGKLADNLNAEIVLGTVGSVKDAVHWLLYTYLFVRMKRAPHLYGITQGGNATDDNKSSSSSSDPHLMQRRIDLVHAAATLLNRHNLIRYHEATGSFTPTALGRVASFYYITHSTMATYNTFLKPTLTDLELFRLFSLSAEFKNVVVRQEEKEELRKLLDRVPVPIKETMEEPSAKVNVLLQSYISQLSLEGFVMSADMVYVHQSAGRLMRAIFEICLRRGWAQLSRRALDLCKMIEHRQWLSATPIRQIPMNLGGLSDDILIKVERKDIPWDRYVDLTPADLGELVRNNKLGKPLHRLVHSIPRVNLDAHLLPLTPSTLRVELAIQPDFLFDPKIHGGSVSFWVLVEDADGETILHHEFFSLRARYAKEEHRISFVVPMTDPAPPQYFVRIIADQWLHAETVLPISFRTVVFPDRFPPPTEVLDLVPLSVSSLKTPEYQALFPKHIKYFNPIQTQTFPSLFETDKNVLVAAPSGSGKTICAEFALMRLFSQNPDARVVYIHPHPAVVRLMFEEWDAKFGEGLGKAVVEFTGELTSDLKLLERAHIVCATPKYWDAVSRRWKKRRAVNDVALYIFDDVEQLGAEGGANSSSSAAWTSGGGSGGASATGGGGGATYEVIVSRVRLMSAFLQKRIRVVALANPIANARDIGDWIGAVPSTTFNFVARPLPLEIRLQGFENPNFTVRLMGMARPAYHAVAAHPEKLLSSLIYAPSRKQAQLTAIDLLSFAAADDKPNVFIRATAEYMQDAITSYGVTNKVLKHTLQSGVAFWHEGLPERDRLAVAALFTAGALGVVVTPASSVWSMGGSAWAAHTVVIMGTEYYDGRSHQYVDYPFSDLLRMMGRATRASLSSSSSSSSHCDEEAMGRCLILCPASRKEYLKKFLYEPLPIESQLHTSLHDHLNAEIVNRGVTSKEAALDYITWTLLYRRLVQNPNYYNLAGTSNIHLSDYLSELIDATLNDLQGSQCVEVKEDENTLAPLNLGMIAAYYYTRYTTLEIFASSVGAKTKLRGLIEIVSSATEFDSLPIRHGEEGLLRQMSLHAVQALPALTAATSGAGSAEDGNGLTSRFQDPHIKTNLLLQSHFSRRNLGAELRSDLGIVLDYSIQLVQALVDVVSSEGWLKPALAAMDMSQMLVQGLWADRDMVLMQIPHITREIAERCATYRKPSKKSLENVDMISVGAGGAGKSEEEEEEEDTGIETVFDLMELDDSIRSQLLMELSNAQMADVASFCNRYPNINLQHEVVSGETAVAGNDVIQVQVNLEREVGTEGMNEGAGIGAVFAPRFPKAKAEGWWLVVGQPSTNTISAIKRVTLGAASSVQLEFPAPEGVEGLMEYTLYFMSDSYLGCDQVYQFAVQIVPPQIEEEGGGAGGENTGDDDI